MILSRANRVPPHRAKYCRDRRRQGRSHATRNSSKRKCNSPRNYQHTASSSSTSNNCSSSSTNKSSFKCNNCNRHFGTNTLLLKHKQKNCNGPCGSSIVECVHCGKQFLSQNGHDQHVRSIHASIIVTNGGNPVDNMNVISFIT